MDIGFFHVVGEGGLKGEFENALNEMVIPNKFYGNLTQAELFELLKISVCIILPSKSEGFPKVLAEAINFGCIPIASNVGSISHYIQDGISGIILNEISTNALNKAWSNFMNLDHNEKQRIAKIGFYLAQKFTFEHYMNNLECKIFNGN
jgi:glycosyltransferase involved in cell wall biosynthesis